MLAHVLSSSLLSWAADIRIRLQHKRTMSQSAEYNALDTLFLILSIAAAPTSRLHSELVRHEGLTGRCHVQLGLIRSVLGDLAPVCPTLDISADIFNQWIGLVLGPNAGLKKQYSPYADDASFMIGALPPFKAACNPFTT